jgi:polyhydroxyalkanoate synthesis repressor PhaR
MNPKIVLIKKYENRRLYDSTNSRYVNLDEVAQMVRQGLDVRVVDAATGEDLTRWVLTQIVVEKAKAPDSAFPLDVLRQMVVASGKATQETSLKYMKTILDMYQNAYRAMAAPVNPFEYTQTPAPHPAAGATDWVSQPDSKRDEKYQVEELRRRVEELEALVSKAAGGKKSKRARSRSRSRS